MRRARRTISEIVKGSDITFRGGNAVKNIFEHFLKWIYIKKGIYWEQIFLLWMGESNNRKDIALNRKEFAPHESNLFLEKAPFQRGFDGQERNREARKDLPCI